MKVDLNPSSGFYRFYKEENESFPGEIGKLVRFIFVPTGNPARFGPILTSTFYFL